MAERDRIEAAAATYGFRLPTEAEARALMLTEHDKMARLFARVGNHDMAAQARAGCTEGEAGMTDYSQEREITSDEREAVIAALAEMGVTAHHQYPGVVSIHGADGEVWTGMHSWTYGSWVKADGEPDEDREDGPMGLTEATSDPKEIAAAWAYAVRPRERQQITLVLTIDPAENDAASLADFIGELEGVVSMDEIHPEKITSERSQ